jgi:putative ABC transport system permease protein
MMFGRRSQRDFKEEIRSHIELEAERLRAQGLSPAEAERAARRNFGNVGFVEERFRVEQPFAWIGGLGRDLNHGWRALLRAPAFLVTTVGTLALAIGAVAGIFSVVNTVLLRPLPFPNPDRLVAIGGTAPGADLPERFDVGVEFYLHYKESKLLDGVAAFAAGTSTLRTDNRVERIPMAWPTIDMFTMFGLRPQLGRLPVPEDEDKVVVISDQLWSSWFGRDPAVIGKSYFVSDGMKQVIGVMPPELRFPSDQILLWVANPIKPDDVRPGQLGASILARMKAGVTEAQLAAELTLLSKELPARYGGPPNYARLIQQHQATVEPLLDRMVGRAATASLWLLFGAVFFVLLIACANIANLLLARAEARSREIAIRNALGADRGRLIRQFLTESLVIGALGAFVGSVLAVWGVDATVALLPATAPRASEIRVDGWVFAFAGLCAIGSSLLFGLAPIFHTRVERLSETLRDGQRTAGSPRQRLRRALVVAEVALAVVLLIGCGLMTRSFVRLSRFDLGFTARGLSTGQLEIASSAYDADAAALGYWLRLEDELRAVPGVVGASVMSGLPPARRLQSNGIELVGRAKSPSGPEWTVDFIQLVGDEYFETLRLRPVAGRFFRAGDDADGAPVVIVNEAFARTFYPGEDPVGKLVRVVADDAATTPQTTQTTPQTIIGVVGDTKQQGLDTPAGSEIYVPLRQSLPIQKFVPHNMHLVVRSGVPPAALFGSIRAIVSSIDPSVPLYRLRTYEDLLGDEVARPRFVTFLLTVFAGLALLLAAVGIYGVMAYTVEQRRRELGIRMALGAQVSGLRRLVLRDGLTLAAAGVAVGLAVAYVTNTLLGHGLSALLYDVRAVDPPTFVGVAAVVLAVATAACAIPAVRATRIDPLTALRSE